MRDVLLFGSQNPFLFRHRQMILKFKRSLLKYFLWKLMQYFKWTKLKLVQKSFPFQIGRNFKVLEWNFFYISVAKRMCRSFGKTFYPIFCLENDVTKNTLLHPLCVFSLIFAQPQPLHTSYTLSKRVNHCTDMAIAYNWLLQCWFIGNIIVVACTGWQYDLNMLP